MLLPAWFAPAAFAFAALAVLGGAVLTAWSLWSDRGRGRRRCGRCWHDLSRTPGLLCGECGWQGRQERDLHRTRRRWRSAILGVVLLACGVAGFGGALPRADLWRSMPTWVLVAALPASGPSLGRDSAYDELRRRLVESPQSLEPDDLERLAARIARGDAEAPPVGLAWEAKYAPLLRRAFPLLAEASPAIAAVRAIPPRIDLAIASPWPSDLPPYASLEAVSWVPEAIQHRFEIDCPDQPTLPPIVVIRDSRAFAAPRFPIEFPPAGLAGEGAMAIDEARGFAAARSPLAHPAAGNPLRLRLRAWWRPVPAAGEAAGPWEALPERWFEQAIVPAAPLAERLQPMESDAADAAVRDAFAAGFIVAAGDRPFAMRFNTAATAIPELDGIAVGVVAEVLEEGIPRRRSWLWWPGGARIHGIGRRGEIAEWRISEEDLEALAGVAEDARWTLRVRGDREMAMRAIAVLGRFDPLAAEACTAYWAGEVEIPLRVLRISAPMRARPWHLPDPEPPVPSDTVPDRGTLERSSLGPP